MLLQDKVAIITGSATGIGYEIASLFAGHGARLLLMDRNPAETGPAAKRADPSGERVVHMLVDVRDRPAIDRAVAAALDRWGRIDILVNNAGIYPRQEFLSMTEAQWDEMQDVNLKSMFHLQQAVLPSMIRQRAGQIVNISSVTFHLGIANLAHYVAAKGGVIGLTRALAREMGPHEVRVNCITPGAVLVEAERAVVTDEQIAVWLTQQSLQRRILPIDIARAALFLASELSSGMTGQTLNVDGGWVMH